MIYRVTARFLQAFDALDSRTQSLALLALRAFKADPRMPTRDARIVSDRNPRNVGKVNDVWEVPFGNGYHLTYSFVDDPHPDHYVCVLRNVDKE